MGYDPPLKMEKNKVFFLKLDHFLSTFCEKGIFTIENPKNLPPQMPDFAATGAMMAATPEISAVTHAILALTLEMG